MAEIKENPHLKNSALRASQNTAGGRVALTLHEILTKVNNAKDKAKKVEILRQHDTPALRQILKRGNNGRRYRVVSIKCDDEINDA